MNLKFCGQTLTNIIEISKRISRKFTFHAMASRVLFVHLTPVFSRGVFRTPSNIRDGVLLCIQLTTLRCQLFTQKHSLLDVSRESEYTCVQIVPGNVLCHHIWWDCVKYLMVYFEFLNGSRKIFLPLNMAEKLHWQHVFKKLEEAENHCLFPY